MVNNPRGSSPLISASIICTELQAHPNRFMTDRSQGKQMKLKRNIQLALGDVGP